MTKHSAYPRNSQLTLGFHLAPEATFANFYAAQNIEIVNQLQASAEFAGEHFIYLCAARSQGVSHLLQACCHHAAHSQISSIYLTMSELCKHSPDSLLGLESLQLVCIDDIQAIAGSSEWEQAVFHLFNRLLDAKHHLIIGGCDLPQSLGFNLPDLRSRLLSGVTYQLRALDDDDKLIILKTRAHQRGIHLSTEVAKYMLNHFPRKMSALFTALDQLDTASLAAQRRITIPFVKETLEI